MTLTKRLYYIGAIFEPTNGRVFEPVPVRVFGPIIGCVFGLETMVWGWGTLLFVSDLPYTQIIREELSSAFNTTGPHPDKVTFGSQDRQGRTAYSIWFVSSELRDYEYNFVVTAEGFDASWQFTGKTAIAPDNFTVVHLICRPRKTK